MSNNFGKFVNGLKQSVFGLKEIISTSAIVTTIVLGAMIYLGVDFISSFYEMNGYYQFQKKLKNLATMMKQIKVLKKLNIIIK